MDKKQIKEVLIYLEKAGVSLIAGNIVGGLIDLDVNGAILYAENRDCFFAEYFGVDLETLRQFNNYVNENWQCTAMTVKGKRCSRDGQQSWTPDEFKFGETTLCTYHQKHLVNTSHNLK